MNLVDRDLTETIQSFVKVGDDCYRICIISTSDPVYIKINISLRSPLRRHLMLRITSPITLSYIDNET